MNVSVLIIEDNPITAQDLSEILQENDMEVMGIQNSAEGALKVIETNPPDVLLVDIKLKGQMSGIDLVNDIRHKYELPIVYLTANSDKETVNKALETQPASFLTKPFEDRDVLIAVELAFKKQFSKMNRREGSKKTFPYVFLKSGSRFEKVKIDDIMFLVADGSYSKVITSEKEYILTGNLHQFINQIGDLGENFLRVHRSYLVNVNAISGLDNDYIFIDDISLPIGRSHRNTVKDVLRRIS